MIIEITITSGDKEREMLAEFPEGWSGLTRKQWESAIIVKVMMQTLLFDEKQFTAAVCNLCLNEKSEVEALGGIGITYITAIAEQITWIEEMPCHADSYFSGRFPFAGPSQFLKNFRMKQYGLAQQFIHGYGDLEATEEHRKKMLRGLMSVTWRLSFLPWSSWMCDVYLKFMWLVPEMYLIKNMYNVWGMVQELRHQYEYVYEHTSSGEGPDHGFRSLLESLAGEKFGDYYTVQKAMLHDVMVHMDHNAHRVQQMKQNNTNTPES